MVATGRGAGEREEREKCRAGQELCLLQRKGLCCHGIFIPLWEMKECDTPIKSVIARQDGQPDPAGRTATGLVSPGLGHSTPPADIPTGLPEPCRGWEGTISHGPPCPLANGSPRSSSPSRATVMACAVCLGEGTGECCQTPVAICSQLKEGECNVPKQNLLSS